YSIGNPPSVFISHSKHDTENVSFFAKILANTGLKGTFMEWEDIDNQYAGSRIADIIRSDVQENTDAIIVLLGQSLENPPTESKQYTHNWVNFEVGVAAGCRKPVWVFEEFDKFHKFPIPYVTDYAQYNLNNNDHLQYYTNILKDRILTSYNTTKPVKNVKCQHENCNASYRLWSKSEVIYCPVCRRLTGGNLADGIQPQI
ncbi:MAG: hypothetical protein ACREA8_03975, partial [Nitrosotalea sp.]